MTWVKLDDAFAENPKVRPLSDRAFRLYVAGLCHCAAQLTDGLIERHKVGALLPKVTKPMVRELVDAVLWLEHADGFEVKDYLKYNPTREQVMRERDAAAERKRRWQEAREAKRNAVPNAVKNAARNGERSGAPPHPAPKGLGVGLGGSPSVVVPSPAPSGGDGRLVDEETKMRNVTEIRAAREQLRGQAS